MSFDLIFLQSTSVGTAPAADFTLPSFQTGPATDEQAAQMRRLIDTVQKATPDVICNESARGFLYGAWLGGGSLPDIDIYPDHLVMSMHMAGAKLDDGVDQRFRDEVLSFLEPLGYLAFDPQKGRLTTSKDFSFRDDSESAPKLPVRVSLIQRPWWRIW